MQVSYAVFVWFGSTIDNSFFLQYLSFLGKIQNCRVTSPYVCEAGPVGIAATKGNLSCKTINYRNWVLSFTGLYVYFVQCSYRPWVCCCTVDLLLPGTAWQRFCHAMLWTAKFSRTCHPCSGLPISFAIFLCTLLTCKTHRTIWITVINKTSETSRCENSATMSLVCRHDAYTGHKTRQTKAQHDTT